MTATRSSMGYATQLARVQTSQPRLVVLAGATAADRGGSIVQARVVVQIRSRLLHFIVNGQLMCVIKSHGDICGMAEWCSTRASAPLQLIVATTDGSLWLLQLPSAHQGIKPILLHASNHIDSGVLRRVGSVPGAQQVAYEPSSDALVCSSLLTPTTVLIDASTPTPYTLELDALEGEQSTCLCIISPQENTEEDQDGLFSWLLHGTAESAALIVIQGDADGCVRYVAVDTTSRRIIHSSTVMHLRNEAVSTMVPIRISSGCGVNALLVIGSRGSVAVVSPKLDNGHIHCGQFSSPLAAVAFLDGTEPTLVLTTTTTGQPLVLAVDKLLAHLVPQESLSKRQPLNDIASTVASLPNSVVCMGVHTATNMVSLLTRSGNVATLPSNRFSSPEQLSEHVAQPEPSDHRVKLLLQDIGRISTQSDLLHHDSGRADDLLRGLHASLQFLRLVKIKGINAVIQCPFHLELADVGWALQSKSVRIKFMADKLQGNDDAAYLRHPQVVSMWRVQLTVRTMATPTTEQGPVLAYSFALGECLGRERVVQLDDSVLQNDHTGMLNVSCELVFAPSSAGGGASTESHASSTNTTSTTSKTPQLFSFAVAVSSQVIHLVQLSEPVDNFPLNAATLREQPFRQDQDPSLRSNSAIPQGHEWWPMIDQNAANCGIDLFRTQEPERPTPPLRFVLHVDNPGIHTTAAPVAIGASSTNGHQLPPQQLTQDAVLALLTRLMDIQGDASRARWRVACRVSSGKWWVGMRTYAGNLVVLRMVAVTTATAAMREVSEEDDAVGTIATPRQNDSGVEITVQASNVADLSAMRALLIDTLAKNNGSGSDGAGRWSEHALSTASLALSATRDELQQLTAMTEDVQRKATASGLASGVGSGHDKEPLDICQDELLQMIQRIAHVETRALELYWKSREVINHRLTL